MEPNLTYTEPSYKELKDLLHNSDNGVKKYGAIIISFIFLTFSLPFVFATSAIYGNQFVILGLVLPFVFFTGSYLIIRRLLARSMRPSAIFRQFAINNNWQYILRTGKVQENIDVNRQLTLPMKQIGAPLLGTNGTISNIVGNSEFSMYAYTYTTGSGKNRKVHYWTIAAYKLNRQLPHLLFDTKKNNFWKFSNLPTSFDRSQIITLESNVDEHFEVYSPEGYSIDTLSFITPEVLDYLVKNCTNFDIEIIEDYVYVYQNKQFTPENFKVIFGILMGFAGHILDNVNYYRDERAASANANMSQRTEISRKGLRLKRSIWQMLTPAVGIGFFLFFWLWSQGGLSGNTFALLSTVPILLVVIIMAYLLYKQQRY